MPAANPAGGDCVGGFSRPSSVADCATRKLSRHLFPTRERRLPYRPGGGDADCEIRFRTAGWSLAVACGCRPGAKPSDLRVGRPHGPSGPESTVSRFRRPALAARRPHFWNVMSNLPFAVIGLLGCWLLIQARRTSSSFSDRGSASRTSCSSSVSLHVFRLRLLPLRAEQRNPGVGPACLQPHADVLLRDRVHRIRQLARGQAHPCSRGPARPVQRRVLELD